MVIHPCVSNSSDSKIGMNVEDAVENSVAIADDEVQRIDEDDGNAEAEVEVEVDGVVVVGVGIGVDD